MHLSLNQKMQKPALSERSRNPLMSQSIQMMTHAFFVPVSKSPTLQPKNSSGSLKNPIFGLNLQYFSETHTFPQSTSQTHCSKQSKNSIISLKTAANDTTIKNSRYIFAPNQELENSTEGIKHSHMYANIFVQ